MAYRIPTGLDLHRIFNQLLIRRVNLSAQYFNAPSDDIAPLPVEQSIHFVEPGEGILVLRSSKIFEELLESKADTSFLELTILFFHQFFREAWGLDTRVLKAALFKPTAPIAWPDRNPDSFCTAFIKDSPLEIRLWSPVTAAEAENWGKFKKQG